MKASNILGINYSSAKTIIRAYKESGKIYKNPKKSRVRSQKKNDNSRINHKRFHCHKVTDTPFYMLSPTFDFSAYKEPIAHLFGLMHTRKVKMIEELQKKITLPLPKNFSSQKQEARDKKKRASI